MDDERSELERQLIERADAFTIGAGSPTDDSFEYAWLARHSGIIAEDHMITPRLLREAADALAECRRALADSVARCVGCGGSGTTPREDVDYTEILLPCTRCDAARAALAKLENKS